MGTAETADLVDLLTAELSNTPAITMVERTDLAKVGDEAKLQQLAGSDAVALAKLIGADGLIFISKSPDGASEVIMGF
jgi:curli biogenesis system outer membrane secretion channel CsgG